MAPAISLGKGERTTMAPHSALLSLVTALPPNILLRTDVAETARRVLADRFADFDKTAQVFETTS
jgi:hypothetical protein